MTTTRTIEHDPVLPERRIAYSTRGHNQGMITRLMSPGDLGEVLKPFVFLYLLIPLTKRLEAGTCIPTRVSPL